MFPSPYQKPARNSIWKMNKIDDIFGGFSFQEKYKHIFQETEKKYEETEHKHDSINI